MSVSTNFFDGLIRDFFNLQSIYTIYLSYFVDVEHYVELKSLTKHLLPMLDDDLCGRQKELAISWVATHIGKKCH